MARARSAISDRAVDELEAAGYLAERAAAFGDEETAGKLRAFADAMRKGLGL